MDLEHPAPGLLSMLSLRQSRCHVQKYRALGQRNNLVGLEQIGAAPVYIPILEQPIGLIVSQDGEVKAVKADGGRLMFWDGILE